MKSVLTLPFALVICACAGNEPVHVASSDESKVCVRELPTGSRVPQVVCRTKAEIEDSTESPPRFEIAPTVVPVSGL